MANINRPNGFRPIRHLNGSMYNGQANLYYIPSTDSNAYAVGDLVAFVGTTNSTVSNIYGVNQQIGVPIVARATAGSVPVLGPIVGFLADPTNLQNSGFNPASNANGRYVWVCDGADVVFEAQLCGAAGVAIAPNITAAAGTNFIGLNASIYAPAATSNFGAGLSGMMVDSSTAAVTSTLAVKIIRYSARIDQDLSTAGLYPKVEIVLNNPFMGNLSAGI
jgi:hypothetical protein